MSRVFARLREALRSPGRAGSEKAGSQQERSSDLGSSLLKLVKYAAIVHCVREYVAEFSLVHGAVQGGQQLCRLQLLTALSRAVRGPQHAAHVQQVGGHRAVRAPVRVCQGDTARRAAASPL